jgi:hypothetical protein
LHAVKRVQICSRFPVIEKRWARADRISRPTLVGDAWRREEMSFRARATEADVSIQRATARGRISSREQVHTEIRYGTSKVAYQIAG